MSDDTPTDGAFDEIVYGPLSEIFGDVIHSYTRAQALEDGTLVDISKTAEEAGFTLPVAMTRTAFESCVAWDGDATQDEDGRLWDVVFMAHVAVKRLGDKGTDRLTYELYVVPRGDAWSEPVLRELVMVIGPGDSGAPVITIMLPGES